MTFYLGQITEDNQRRLKGARFFLNGRKGTLAEEATLLKWKNVFAVIDYRVLRGIKKQEMNYLPLKQILSFREETTFEGALCTGNQTRSC